ncbi:hypothetical protein F4780DRAFT_721369 [Xylariomycetidae sp. FL0641]|nr:hypothetical protein F4780DRAFT_721369 [Xylariomycetidae sp. FL0641]
MVSSRKRARRDTDPGPDAEPPNQTNPASPLQRIRNCWQFANLFQWIYLFGRVVKIDENFDIEDLEAECLKPSSTVLVHIGLSLLKSVSSHRGLTPELFDEYTRRQYVAKAPAKNPFGTEETPAHFDDFDALTKIRVLQQLTQWVMLHPERVREKMDEQKPSDQTEWRIEPAGWDSDDRTYYILDDNRLYRMTPAPSTPAPWKPKKNTKKAKAAARAAKRRRTTRHTAQSSENADDEHSDTEAPEPEDDGLGGAQWECIGASLGEIRAFLNTVRKTRDENEKVLRGAVEEHLLPILEKQEESRKRKALQREKELQNLEKMAHAKRSSRIAGKLEQQKVQEQAKEEEDKRRAEEIAARKEAQTRVKMEKERDNRLMSREQRLKERESRRVRHEEELAQLSESTGSGRLSGRRLKAEIERNKQALQELEEEEDDWIFDCVCGVYGQVDDGTHSVACERCNVWQHSKCVGISEEEAERDDFHYICQPCREQRSGRSDDSKATVIKLKVNRPNAATSPSDRDRTDSPIPPPADSARQSDIVVEIPTKRESPKLPGAHQPAQLEPGPPRAGHATVPKKTDGQSSTAVPPSPYTNGDGPHPFSSPHPTLSPPEQSPTKSKAYSTLFHPSSPNSGDPPSTGEPKVPQKGVFHISPRANGHNKTPKGQLPPFTGTSGLSMTVRSESPRKQPVDVVSTYSAVSSTPAGPSQTFPAPAQTPSSGTSPPPHVLSPPQLDNSSLRQGEITPTLPPSRNGLSPSKKRSPPPPPQQANSSVHSTPAPAILPPVAALSPSPSEQIMTPPVKPSDSARPVSQQSSGLAGDVI